MAKTVFDTSMSLDGFMTAPNQTPEEPLGEGGLRLHAWAFESDETNQRYMAAKHTIDSTWHTTAPAIGSGWTPVMRW